MTRLACFLGIALLFPDHPDVPSPRGNAGGTRPDCTGICGPRRNNEKLAECLAAGESGFEARCAFCRALSRGISGTPLGPLRQLCWSFTQATMVEWANWCHWAWGGA